MNNDHPIPVANGALVARPWRAPAAAPSGLPAAAAPTAPCPPVSPEGHGGAALAARGAGDRANGRAGGHPAGRAGAANGAPGGALAGATGHGPIDAETVIARLEEAGRTLLALPAGGYSTRLCSSSIAVVRSALEGYGWQNGSAEQTRLRPPVPPVAAITRRDQAMGWIALIPADRYVLRRIVGARSLVSPVTERKLFPWRRLGLLLGAAHKAVQRWHAQGIDMIVAALRRR